MISYWLNKVLGSDETENLGKLVPLIVFFVIWVVGAIAKAAQKGKKGTQEQPTEGQEKHEPGFGDIAKKIRERYAHAQKEVGREVQQEENEQFSPPVRSSQPGPSPPRRPEPGPSRKPRRPKPKSQPSFVSPCPLRPAFRGECFERSTPPGVV